jgi:hypothetical protein
VFRGELGFPGFAGFLARFDGLRPPSHFSLSRPELSG